MGWKERFSVTILQRGFDYYRKGKVQNLLRTGNTFSADVVGTETYYVTAVLREGKVSALRCDCPYAQDGHYCKHESALLYQVQDTYGEEAFYAKAEPMPPEYLHKANRIQSGRTLPGDLPMQKVEEPVVRKEIPLVHPFQKPQDGKYRYFKLSELTKGMVIKADVYEDAKQLVDSHALKVMKKSFSFVSNYKTGGDYTGSFLCTLGSANSLGYLYTPYVNITFTKDKVLSFKCANIATSCHASDITEYTNGGDNPLCAHKVAALLLLEHTLEEENPGDSTDKAGRSFLDAFRKKTVIEKKRLVKKEKESPLDIEPSLTHDSYRGPAVSFRLGREKLYVLKDINALLEAWNQRRLLAYGKDLTVDFASDDLTGRATKCLHFLNTLPDRSRLYSRGNTVELGGQPLDTFFSEFKDEEVLLDRKQSLKFREESPTFHMTLQEVYDRGHEFSGIRAKGIIPVGWKGRNYSYRFVGDTLLRCNLSGLGPAGILADYADEAGNFTFTIGRKELDNFYTRILPELRHYGDVDTSGLQEINGYLKPEPHFSFLVDYDGKYIFSSASVTYDEKTYPLLPTQPKGLEDERNQIAESEVREVLYQLFENTEEDLWHSSIEDDSIYHFLTVGLSTLKEYGEVLVSESLQKLKMKPLPPVSARVTMDSTLLELSLDSRQLSVKELLEVLDSYKKKKIYHRFRDGSFVNLETENLEGLLAIYEGLSLSPKDFTEGKMHLPLYRALYLDLILSEQKDIPYERDLAFRKLIRDFKSIEESDYEVPSCLKDTLRPYQKEGYRWMRVLLEHGFGGILADDMGLGKTLQLLTLLQAFKEEGKGGTSLIVTPASLVYNWKAEAEKFTPSLKVRVVSGKQREREECIRTYEDYDVLITSYDLLKRDIALYDGKEFQLETIDEAQFIKNHNTAAAKSVRAIRAHHKLALTGTPIENRLLELWSIFEYLMPGFLYSNDYFRKNVESVIMKDSDKSVSRRLKKMVSPFILRRLKSDVLKELPEKIEEVRYTELQGEQKRLYTAQVAHLKKSLSDKKDRHAKEDDKLEILAELTKIRQICCDPSLLFENYEGESAKREAVIDLVKSAIDGGHRVLLFSQFTSMLGLLEKNLDKEDIQYFVITGDTSKEKRMELVDAFNNGSVPVFLISLKAGGTGLNLTGADVVIHYDPWWNLAVQNQATDRAHRIGQTKIVSVFKMIAKDTLEERILELQEKKKSLADEVVSQDHVSLTTLSRDEILEILSR